MKAKKLKIVFPAIAFMLAIVASFAFTQVQNDMEEDSMFVTGYVRNIWTASPACISVPERCSTSNPGPVCRTSLNYIVDEVIIIPPGQAIHTLLFGTACVDYLYQPLY